MGGNFERIDAHQHFWQLGRFDYDWLRADPLEPIRRNFLPADLSSELDACGIDRSIFVQTQHNVDETRWVLEMTAEHAFLAGVVGWIDLASPQCERQLLELRDHPGFVGVRHVTHDEPDRDFIIRPDVLRGLEVLERYQVPFDLLFFVEHLPHADTLAQKFPNLKMVIDHLAKPHIREQTIDDWLPALRNAARHPNVYCKLSGMVTEAKWHAWKRTMFEPYFDMVLEHFGPSRIMYGSDWPVCLLSGSYREVFELAESLTAALTDAERQRIWSGTAREFYQLP